MADVQVRTASPSAPASPRPDAEAGASSLDPPSGGAAEFSAIAPMNTDDDALPDAQPAPREDPATVGMSSTTRPAPDSPPRPPPAEEKEEETEEQRAEKKRKLDAVKKESRQRGARMFGVMMGTLQRAKREVKQVEQTDAGRKRAELQERLREKLEGERRQAADKAQREREAKDLKLEVLRREEELALADRLFRTRQSAKLASARFLCTTFTPPPVPATASHDLLPPISNPRLPHAFRTTDPRVPAPIYYLPYRLLPSQEDRLDDQLDAVRKSRDAEEREYDAKRRDKLRELDEAKKKRSEREQELERAERDERQRRRREEEEREDKERVAKAAERGAGSGARRRSSVEPGGGERRRSGSPEGPTHSDRPRENGAGAASEQQDRAAAAPTGNDDVSMGDAAGGAEMRKQSAPPEPATDGMNGDRDETLSAADAATVENDAKMDDELEY